jgi:GldM N-terminal domain
MKKYYSLIVLLSVLNSCGSEVQTTEPPHVVHDIDYSIMTEKQKVETITAEIEKISPESGRKAQQVRQQSDALKRYIKGLKDRMADAAGGENDNGDIAHPANQQAVVKIMIKGKAGDTLKKKIGALHTYLAQQTSNADSFDKVIPLKIETFTMRGQPEQDWVAENFDGIPVVAGVTILTKFIYDLNNSEWMVLNDILKQARSKGAVR